MSEDVVNGLLSLALLVASGLFGVLIKWLNAKIGTEKVRQYANKASTVVAAAEQMGAALGWTDEVKKKYAVDLMVKLGLDQEDAEAFVEAAVAQMIQYQTELTTDATGSVVLKTPAPAIL
jgi:hypothetical protein